ncbi:hypothetical protein GCK72_025388 [Caenorhabditis remanei]|uniref:Uncharacterized protein n=1 Tax=Caenorhabditis remanei TaxID=31234 RepID=A0A6A5G2D4_CAERE|nr:hypothetical protein GCK72_025388 [Caenorhabditis remanei]KAF1748921.1 hypothetical protein GCK72_025388 [Caenorhabditis remanei]
MPLSLSLASRVGDTVLLLLSGEKPSGDEDQRNDAEEPDGGEGDDSGGGGEERVDLVDLVHVEWWRGGDDWGSHGYLVGKALKKYYRGC